MKVLGWLKVALTIVFGLGIGMVVTGLVNLVHPMDTIGWLIGAVLVASALSALAGFLIAGPWRKKPAAAATKDAGTGAQKTKDGT